MQSRFATLAATTTLAVGLGFFAMAATAAETEHDKHVFVNNLDGSAATEEDAAAPGAVEAPSQADPLTDGLMIIRSMATPEEEAAIGSANGGVWKTTDGASAATPADEVSNGEGAAQTDGLLIIRHLFGAAPAPSTPGDVTTTPAEGRTDYLLELDDVPGESGEAAQSAPATPGSVDSGQQGQAALLVPAVQKVRDSASRTAGGPHDDGVVLLANEEPAAAAASGTGTLTLSNGNGAAADPEGAQAQQAAQEERPRRGRFSLSIGGVTLSSDGGVNVAVGDVDGDGRGARSSTPQRTRAPSRAR